MATTKADFDAVLAAIDTETTRIATRVLELLEQVKGGGLSETEEAEIFAQATAQLEKLKGIAADPANPIPPDTGGSSQTEPPPEVDPNA